MKNKTPTDVAIKIVVTSRWVFGALSLGLLALVIFA